jgi:hypothetical protein
MASRRSVERWEALQPSYRARLERSGISRHLYLSGLPLTGARGHARTPERPERAERQPAKYHEYIQRQLPLDTQVVLDHVIDDVLSPGLRQIKSFDITTIERNIEASGPHIRRLMMRTQTMTEWQQLAVSNSEYAVYIDGESINPFWYH